MRQQLLDYLTANLTGSIKTSTELPFESGGAALYQKNMRRVYLDEEFTEQSQLIGVIGADDIMQQITTVRAYLTVDAKNRNADLDSALTTMANARVSANIPDSFRKEFSYSTTIDNDELLYEFEYQFYTLA
jgi:hypothetical protein